MALINIKSRIVEQYKGWFIYTIKERPNSFYNEYAAFLECKKKRSIIYMDINMVKKYIDNYYIREKKHGKRTISTNDGKYKTTK